jgi:hypothetical protein
MTNYLKPKVLQILNEPHKNGGIQAVAKVLTEAFRIKGVGCIESSMKLMNIFTQIIFYRKNLPSIVIVHGMSNLVTFRALIYLLFRGVLMCKPDKVIWQAHFHPFTHHRLPLIAKLYFYSINYALAYISDILVAITPDEKKHLEKLAKPSKIRIIPNPLRSFSKEVGSKPDIFSQATSDSFEPYVLTIGRNDHNKNLAAVSVLTDVISNAGYKSYIVTNNKDNIHPNCEVYLNCSDHELNHLIANAFCVVIPAKYEAFSLVAIESIARGTPIICGSSVGALSFDAVRQAAVITDFTESSFLNSLEEIKLLQHVSNKSSQEVKNLFSGAQYGDNWFELIKHF